MNSAVCGMLEETKKWGERHMKTFDTSILTVEISTLASGYRALDLLTQDDLQLIDASPCGDRKFLIVLSGDEKSLQAAFEKLKGFETSSGAGVLDHELIKSVDRKVLEAAFSLAPQKIRQSVVIVETDTVSSCLSVVNASVKDHGMDVLEIRIQRTGLGGALAFMTGPSDAAALVTEVCRAKLKHDMRNGNVELVAQPSAGFRSLFEFSN
ncbi:MAG: hypothetical protein V4692_07405 [Bdellovibrionota bacterium]